MPRIGLMTAALTILYVVAGIGTFNLLSQYFAGHPFADAWAGLMNVHTN